MRTLPPATERLGVPPLPADARDALDDLRQRLDGDLRTDPVHRVLFATDASLYEVLPFGVAFPRHAEDLEAIVRTCAQARIPITPRAAGTSLAGQTVGPGLIVDTGRHMKAILDVDEHTRTARVQPGVILDDLNRHLAPRGLFFGPDTSTANRCMIGGMIGNNSCGSHSILHGTTRDHVRALDVLLADGSRHILRPMDRAAWDEHARADNRLGHAMRALQALLAEHADTIRTHFPDPRVRRRNTGYALDDLLGSFLGGTDQPADLTRFLCGSEGTLALTAEATLNLVDAPRHTLLVAAHFTSLQASLEATVEAVRHQPAAVELMDRRILELSRLNAEQDRNRWFIQGDPDALLVIEFQGQSAEECHDRAHRLVREFQAAGLGYAHPVIPPERTASVWALRKAGLGVLMGAPGDVKPITLVEDTAVAVEDLPDFIDAFRGIMAHHGAECVYYAHASVGELHLRPELNPKDAADRDRAEHIARDVALLVRQFRGSLSGEHGDGRLRSPFLAEAMGPEVIPLLEAVKDAFDPDHLLNPGNIVRPAPFQDDWRYPPDYAEPALDTHFAYASAGGFQRMVERCNGAGVCRRNAEAGGTMCPSYMVTHEERESTRGRANLFRRAIQLGPDALHTSTELRDALDLCISCKGCRSDCPASVDMARLKAEFTQGWMDRHGAPLSSRAVAELPRLARLATALPGGAALANLAQRTGPLKALLGRTLDVHPDRQLPAFAPRSAHHQLARRTPRPPNDPHGTVLLYIDEFTDLYEPELAL
ncbi:MAG: FAD-binding oxidoreductase, partial [Deltaproteobacteria bacterium]